MPPETVNPADLPPLQRLIVRLIDRVPVFWRGPLLRLTLAWVVLFVLFLPDWRAMAWQWWDSSTYNHILMVPAILVWLVSQRTTALARLQPSTWWPGLLVCAGALFVWLLGEFAGLAMAQQLAAVVLLQGSALTVLGPQVAAALLFPLGYMVFLVPFGDELIPTLQTVTARLTMAFLAISQVPATIDGVFITTSGGYFEVAEACSGVKFLIAMIAYGTLVANVCFRRWPRRAAFMAAAVAVPILANGLRAWGTIWIAGWYGIAFASGFDHVFYGWFFFAFVMALVMAVGWRYFDRAIDDPMVDPTAILASPLLDRLAALRIGNGAALGALAGLCALFLGWAALAERLAAPLPADLALPQVRGWSMVALGSGAEWMPLHGGADRRLRARYGDTAGHVVDLSFALYDRQTDGKEAGGFGQGALPLGSHWAWERAGPDFAFGKSDVIQAPGPVHRLAVTWYRDGGVITGSNLRLKLANMLDRLLLRRRATATLILSAQDGQGPAPADLIERFRSAGGPLPAWFDHIASGQNQGAR
ncbi:exosortase A [Novosphingobium sp.]|uniref:exosortase A n=1 Tax=Novosphingobium sp. TaxID=1874826 RepID=UPI0038B952EB